MTYQEFAWLGTGVAAVAAVWRLLVELRNARLQRKRDLRWKQAEAGKALNDQFLNDQWAWSAAQMLDYAGNPCALPGFADELIEFADIRLALDPAHHTLSKKHLAIRKCFDRLFYYMAIMEHYVAATLVDAADVRFPIDYYVTILSKHRDVAERYLSLYGLGRAAEFLDRFEPWRRAGGEKAR